MYPEEMLVEVTIDGATVVGPVTIDQLRRGVAAGRVPHNAHVRPPGSFAWSPLSAFLGPPQPGYVPAQAPVAYHHQPQAWAQPAPHAAAPAQQPPQLHWTQQPQPPPAVSHAPAPRPPPPPVPTGAQLTALQREISAAEQRLCEVRRELESVEEAVEIQSFGFYKARYGFESSEDYVERLRQTRDEQKLLIKQGEATACTTKWTVDGSAAEGKKLVQQQSKLMLRAFNGEADAAIAKVRYDNVVNLEQRISKSFAELNKLGEAKKISITKRYFDLKVAELRLVHEHREKVHEEKEEQKAIRERLRDEEKALAEAARMQAEAEAEATRKEAALEKARAELADAAGKQHAKLEALVTRLETELSAALDRKAKAIARAQLTKSGHVYVLSNIGSFGEGVFKIGMTRRFEPLERVDELGDASVPFPFDVHAIIYCEDAPGLENRLHKAFDHRRVNAVNKRKEYFRVTLDEIRGEVAKHHGLVSFMLHAEAEEYRKTLSAAAS